VIYLTDVSPCDTIKLGLIVSSRRLIVAQVEAKFTLNVSPKPEEPKPEAENDRISIPLHVDHWDEYFLHIAQVVAIKSKDPKCPVGAVIVSEDNIILSTGFNGLARGVHDDDETLFDAEEKIKVICHAEGNAIVNAARLGGQGLKGATIYVTKFPCLTCCNGLIQAGIKRIYTHDDSFWDEDPLDKDHSRKKRVLHEAHIEVVAPYHPAFKPTEQITVPKRKTSRKKPGGSAPLLDGMDKKAE
jgi:dCMP deaminase